MKKLNSCIGASAVEFALVLPLLAVILFGIVEFGLLLFNKQVITNASREGARSGVVATTPRKSVADITQTVTNYCQSNVIGFPKSIPYLPSGSCTPCVKYGDPLTVTVKYDYSFLVFPNLLGLIHGSNIISPYTLTATTVMKCE